MKKEKTGMINIPVLHILIVNSNKAGSNPDHPTGGIFQPCYPVSSMLQIHGDINMIMLLIVLPCILDS